MISRSSFQGVFPIKKLGEVAEFLDHKRRPITAKDRIKGPYPYYGANGQQDSVSDYIFDEPLIIVAEDGGHFENPDRGIAYRIDGKCWVNNHAHVLRPNAGVDLAYLCRVLENYDVSPYISGTTRAKLTKGQAENIEIPLPPLAEQKRIASILDQADDLRRKRQRSLDHLSTLGQAIFHEMFGDIRTAAQRYPTMPFGQIADVRLGKMLDQGKRKGGAMLPYLRNANVRWFEFELTDILEMEFSDSELERFGIHYGDLLICEGGEPGRCAVWRENHKTIYYQKALHRARVNADYALPDFIAHWFSNAAQSGMLEDSVTSATIAHLTCEKIKRLQIFLPPLEMQKIFISHLAEIAGTFQSEQRGIGGMEALFQSLQHRAFRGEL